MDRYTFRHDDEAGDRWAWWQTGVIYQIYPFSFHDHSGNGIGDLPGIIGKLDYVERLGVKAIWLSPIFPSPMHDNGYDVADYRGISPLFGNLDDFDRLLEETHRRGLKLILDMVPNHTSDEHPWFEESRRSRDDPKRDWYIWRDPDSRGGPPNNWLSYFGGPAWTFDQTTGQHYLHQFDTHQPELNYRHPQVLPAMLDNMRFWLDRGVDGFRVDVMALLMKDKEFRDEPSNPDWDGVNPHDALMHVHTRDLDEVHTIVRRFRAVLDSYQDRFMVGEIHLPFERLVRYYGAQCDEAHLPFNFHLLETPWRAGAIRELVQRYELALPQGAWPNWVNGNHDRTRTATRVGPRQARVANMLLLTLRGTPTVYYGEELGMEDVEIPAEKARDPIAKNLPGKASRLARDKCRTPMPWDSSSHAGFTGAAGGPWLPLGPDWRERNVAAQERQQDSHLAFFRRLAHLRRAEPALSQGAYSTIEEVRDHEDVLAFMRIAPKVDAFLICLNFADESRIVDLQAVKTHGEIVVSTMMDRQGPAELSHLALRANEGLVLRI